jgi:integrase
MNFEAEIIPMPVGLNESVLEIMSTPVSPASKQRPRRNFFPKARQSTSKSDSKADVAKLSEAATDSTTLKGIGSTVSRRRFQRGTVYLNSTKTQWLGAYSEYALDTHGVERRKRVRIVLSPARKGDGTPVRKSEAKNLLQPYLNRVNEQSTFPSRERKTATFEGFAEIWERDYLILSKPSTQSSVRTQLRTLKAEFGKKDMRTIDAGDVQRLISKLTRAGREPKTIRNMWGTISLIWQAALAQKFVDATLPKPKLPKAVRKKPRFFKLADVGSIIASVNGTQRCLYWLLAETGIRAGELAGLRIQDVALDYITVEQSVWGGKEQAPKTRNAVRKIAMSPQLAELLWKQIGLQKTLKHSFLFSVGTGSPLDMNVERSRRFAPILEALEMPKAGYHAFRHFNVSLMDSLRVPLKTIQERIGHALTGSFTLDVYGHTLDWKANEEAAASLGLVIAKAVTETESNLNSGPLTAHNEEGFQTRSLEAIQNS